MGLTYTDPERPTDVPPEPQRDHDKPPHLCAEHGCLNTKGGALGQAPELCADHALMAMGVRA